MRRPISTLRRKVSYSFINSILISNINTLTLLLSGMCYVNIKLRASMLAPGSLVVALVELVEVQVLTSSTRCLLT